MLGGHLSRVPFPVSRLLYGNGSVAHLDADRFRLYIWWWGRLAVVVGRRKRGEKDEIIIFGKIRSKESLRRLSG